MRVNISSKTGPISCLFLFMLCSGCCTKQQSSDFSVDHSLIAPEILRLHGPRKLDVLLYPERVNSYRTEKIPLFDASGKKREGLDYQIVDQGPDLSLDQIEHLRRLYIDMRGYDSLRRKETEHYFPFEGLRVFGTGCEWKPDIALEYQRAGDSVRVIICFGCSMWAFESEGKRYGMFGFAENQRSSGLQPMLRHTTIELFPEMMNYIPRHDHSR